MVAVLAAYVEAQEHVAREQINVAIKKHKQSNETKLKCPTILQMLQCISLRKASTKWTRHTSSCQDRTDNCTACSHKFKKLQDALSSTFSRNDNRKGHKTQSPGLSGLSTSCESSLRPQANCEKRLTSLARTCIARSIAAEVIGTSDLVSLLRVENLSTICDDSTNMDSLGLSR